MMGDYELTNAKTSKIMDADFKLFH